jgi:hypothetical protein
MSLHPTLSATHPEEKVESEHQILDAAVAAVKRPSSTHDDDENSQTCPGISKLTTKKPTYDRALCLPWFE